MLAPQVLLPAEFETTMWGKKNAPNYYYLWNNFVKHRSVLISFGTRKFPIIYVFRILYKMENREPA